jgi:hypothetical protein
MFDKAPLVASPIEMTMSSTTPVTALSTVRCPFVSKQKE